MKINEEQFQVIESRLIQEKSRRMYERLHLMGYTYKQISKLLKRSEKTTFEHTKIRDWMV